MPHLRHPEPMKMGPVQGIVAPGPRAWTKAGLSLVPRARIMSLAWTSCEPEPVAPAIPGSTKSSLLHLAMSAGAAGPRGADGHGDPSRLLRRIGRAQGHRRRLHP